jgi:hypothetical protein
MHSQRQTTVRRVLQYALATGLLIGLLAVPISAHAQPDSDRAEVAPIASRTVLSSLSARWWTYVLQHLDAFTTTACADSGTPRVIFLFGSMDNQPRKESCQLKVGTLVFFPLATQVAINTPPVFGNGSSRDLHRCASDLATPASNLHLSVDRVSLANQVLFTLRAESPTFTVDGAIFGLVGGFPAASDGYWGLIPLLIPGTHILKFGSIVPERSSSLTNCGPVRPNIQDITYTLDVRQ